MSSRIRNFFKKFLPSSAKANEQYANKIIQQLDSLEKRFNMQSDYDKKLDEKLDSLIQDAEKFNAQLIDNGKTIEKELQIIGETSTTIKTELDETNENLSNRIAETNETITKRLDLFQKSTCELDSKLRENNLVLVKELDMLHRSDQEIQTAISENTDSISAKLGEHATEIKEQLATLNKNETVLGKQLYDSEANLAELKTATKALNDNFSEQLVLLQQKFAEIERINSIFFDSVDNFKNSIKATGTKYSEEIKKSLIDVADELISHHYESETQMIKSLGSNIINEMQKIASQEQRKGVGSLKYFLLNSYNRTTPQPRLNYFALNILSHCNLNCKGCDHFAPLAEKYFVELDVIVKDLQRMAELTDSKVTRIGIMGGEPLLHPQLNEISYYARKYFPKTNIQIVTNGILLNKQDEAFWNSCKDNDIAIVVTKYPLSLDFEQMEETARKYQVHFEYFGKTGEVQKTLYKMPMDPLGTQNTAKSFLECYHVNECALLMEGKFYPCTIIPNAKHFNEKFGTDMAVEDGDYVDIYKIKTSDDIYNFLCTPKPFCRYCKTNERSYGHSWETSKKDISEWT